MWTKMAMLVLSCAACYDAVPADPAGTHEDAAVPDGSGGSSGQVTITCAESPEANTFGDASNAGCTITPFEFCTVSSGGTILPDGGVLGGTVTCRSACLASEYAVICFSSDGGSPAPLDSALDCHGMGGPTPPDVSSYCCPCG
jgi:hypothetical protein